MNSCSKNLQNLLPPIRLKQKIPLDNNLNSHVANYRKQITNILNRQDNRLLLIIGPCSIHDPVATLDYANRIRKLAKEHQQCLLIVMRAYFEKPRTNIGWQGLIKDPNLDNSFDINKGLTIARELLFEINNIGLSVATEFIDPITAQYYSDLISWGAIGARTTESQIHRNLASGLPMPIGFKNTTTGNTQVAIDAILAATAPQQYLGINDLGSACAIHTNGNKNMHIILRGSSETGPNYYANHIEKSIKQVNQINQTNNINKILPNIMIDCSHGNSNKDYTKQKIVANNIIEQLNSPIGSNIIGLMIESFIDSGNQKLENFNNKLKYGLSITDGCISWEDTQELVYNIAQGVKNNRFNQSNKQLEHMQ